MRICSCDPLIPNIISEADNCKSINNFLLEKINDPCQTQLPRIILRPTRDNIRFLKPQFVIGVGKSFHHICKLGGRKVTFAELSEQISSKGVVGFSELMLAEVDHHEDIDGQEDDHENCDNDGSHFPLENLWVFSSLGKKQSLVLFLLSHRCVLH